MSNKRSLWNSAIIVAGVSSVIAFLAYFLPVSSTTVSPVADHWRTVATSFVAALFIGAAIEFLSGLKNFKSGMRTAYRLIAVSILLYSLGFSQLPITAIFNLWNSEWLSGGAAILPFVLGGVFMYAGMRRFALLLHVDSWLTSFKRVIALTTLAMVTMAVLATYLETTGVEGTNIYIAVVSWAGAYLLCATLLLRRILTDIGKEYKSAMQRLEIALFTFFLASAHEAITSFFVKIGQPFVDYGIYMWVFWVAGCLLVWAGSAFREIGIYYETADASAAKLALADKDYLDSITVIASLASRPQDIDPILDKLRTITAGLKPGAALSAHDKEQLVRVYGDVEDYLINNDPLRKFTREELRERSRPAFVAALAD